MLSRQSTQVPKTSKTSAFGWELTGILTPNQPLVRSRRKRVRTAFEWQAFAYP
jgi:hypothetical protein